MRIQIDPDMDALSMLRHHFLSSNFFDGGEEPDVVVEPPCYRVPRITEVELDAEDCHALSMLIGRVITFGDVDGVPTRLFNVPVKWASKSPR